MIRRILLQKDLIFSMARREISLKYAGSYLSWLWPFIQPLVMVLVFWFVFSVGFRVKPSSDVPFVVWLTAGLAAWFVFNEIINGSAALVVSNANLVKKTLFPSEILPIVLVLTSLFAHSIFLIILIGLLFFQKLPFSVFYFQAAYYLLCLTVLAVGLSWILSSLNVFIRDVGHMVTVIMQVGFWVTPIFWVSAMMSPKIQKVLQINPIFYIIQGYRDSFIDFVPFWSHPYQTLYFWFCALAFLFIGSHVFMKMKPQFPDVL